MVAEYITHLKVAYEVAKALKTATDSVEDANIKFQIAELISALADAKIEAANNIEKVVELEKQLERKRALKYDGKKYFFDVEGSEKDGPFCQTCYDTKSQEVRLSKFDTSGEIEWYCRVCNITF